ncbi:MAG: transketolase C-terminal domain-containing protein, partial [Pseudomonadota bacterium]
AKIMEVFGKDNPSGRYIHYGIREHAMVAAMSGMALHGGVIPYGGTFLVFSDYCRPAIRLAALMGLRVIYVFTHDSIGLGEDGPTHQPVEHLAGLRLIPNLRVLRPADAIETAECWQIALQNTTGPTIVALTRQGLPCLEQRATAHNRCAHGAYVLQDWQNDQAKICLIATGSEVAIAIEAAQSLKEQGILARVVSMPDREAFSAQAHAQQKAIMGDTPRIVIEAGIITGWERILGADGTFIGMKTFGASAPAGELFTHFGITANAVVDAAKALTKARS